MAAIFGPKKYSLTQCWAVTIDSKEYGLDTIQLIWKMGYGAPGCDTDVGSPIARATNQLFKEGKPFSNLCMCFFKDTSATLRWFGVFVQSAGNRIVFFPGFAHDFDQIQGIHGNSLQWHQSFDFDHISLEKDRSKWHVTSTFSKRHLGSPRTLPLDRTRVLWFGISIAAPHVMRHVKQETKIVVNTPPSDSRRIYEVFRKARESVKFPIVSLNEDHPIPFSEWFLHFGLIVGPKGFQPYLGGELGFPFGSPCLIRPLPEKLIGLPIRSHKLELSDNNDIQIVVCCLPGRLKIPVAITGTSESYTALNTDSP